MARWGILVAAACLSLPAIWWMSNVDHSLRLRAKHRAEIVPGVKRRAIIVPGEALSHDVSITDGPREDPMNLECREDSNHLPGKLDLDTLFLHVGKAGGGSVEYRYKKIWELDMPRVHPRPKKKIVNGMPPDASIMISIRDPIDRYESAFYWRLTVICDPDGDTRAEAGKEGNPTSHPDKFCKMGNNRETEALFHTYHRNATLLAEALYEDGEVGEKAREDLSTIGHAGSPLHQWLDFDWNNRLFPVVLEKPLDIDTQVDAFFEWLYRRQPFEDPSTFACRRSAVENHDRESRASSAHSSGHTKQDMSLKALRNLARYHEKDYKVLQKILDMGACHTGACEMGIQSILDRRADLLREVGIAFSP